MSTKNYRYGLLPPTTNRDLVLEQLKLAHAYRETLVQIELDRRAEVDAILRQQCPGLREVEAEIVAVETAIETLVKAKAARNAAERRKRRDPETTAKIKELRADLKTKRVRRKQLRTELFDASATQTALAESDQRTAAAIRKARAECDVFWGSYLLIEQSLSQIRKGSPPGVFSLPVFQVERGGVPGTGFVPLSVSGALCWASASLGRYWWH